MSGIGDTYICANCGGIFEKVISDEEARAEAIEVWGQEAADMVQSIICHPCYKEFYIWAKEKGLIKGE